MDIAVIMSTYGLRSKNVRFRYDILHSQKFSLKENFFFSSEIIHPLTSQRRKSNLHSCKFSIQTSSYPTTNAMQLRNDKKKLRQNGERS